MAIFSESLQPLGTANRHACLTYPAVINLESYQLCSEPSRSGNYETGKPDVILSFPVSDIADLRLIYLLFAAIESGQR